MRLLRHGVGAVRVPRRRRLLRRRDVLQLRRRLELPGAPFPRREQGQRGPLRGERLPERLRADHLHRGLPRRPGHGGPPGGSLQGPGDRRRLAQGLLLLREHGRLHRRRLVQQARHRPGRRGLPAALPQGLRPRLRGGPLRGGLRHRLLGQRRCLPGVPQRRCWRVHDLGREERGGHVGGGAGPEVGGHRLRRERHRRQPERHHCRAGALQGNRRQVHCGWGPRHLPRNQA
mmetsp:Transcript_82787/g.234831  ORF Transcript_82787/g.234831 Transcript_82787/m.234831 type:complete len:231 (+) Transcript_82787:2-694(+)